jgi:hypothetical protein
MTEEAKRLKFAEHEQVHVSLVGDYVISYCG